LNIALHCFRLQTSIRQGINYILWERSGGSSSHEQCLGFLVDLSVVVGIGMGDPMNGNKGRRACGPCTSKSFRGERHLWKDGARKEIPNKAPKTPKADGSHSSLEATTPEGSQPVTLTFAYKKYEPNNVIGKYVVAFL
jgi:hypothetical protein